MNWNYSDLIWEIENFESQGFKFIMKILFLEPYIGQGLEVIYGEFIATKSDELTNFKQDYVEYTHIHYHSVIIEPSDLKKFVELCNYYKRIQYMKNKEKMSREMIKSKLNKDNDLFDDFFEGEYVFAKIFHRDVSLLNLNYTSDCKYYDSDPIDYSQSIDSSTAYYQLDFSVKAADLREFDELISHNLDYYPSIGDLIIDKFGRDIINDKVQLKNSLQFIFPKKHIGEVKINLVGNKLMTRIVNIKRDNLLFKFQVKRSDTLEIDHHAILFDEKNLEKKIELEFIPDSLEGYLLDKVDDEYYEYKIQKIVEKFDVTKSGYTDEETLRKIMLDGENLKTEFKLMYPSKKNNLKDLKETKIIELICSFANSEGGVIIFGVDDEDAEIKGYDVTKQFKSQGDFEQHIQRLSNKEIEPPVTTQVYKTYIDNQTLQIVQIFPNNDNWVRIKNSKKIMIRKGSTSRRVVPDDLKKCRKNIIF